MKRSTRAAVAVLATAVAAVTITSVSAASAAPSTDQGTTLVTLVQDEKLAMDVYNELAEQSPVFARVAQSEARHLQIVRDLMDARGVADPTAGMPAGEFVATTYTNAYQDFVARGLVSPEAAGQVGVDIEKQDLADLEKTRVALPNDAVVLDRLTRASNQHLKVFTAVSQGQELGSGMMNGRGQGAGQGSGRGQGAMNGRGPGTGTPGMDCPMS